MSQIEQDLYRNIEELQEKCAYVEQQSKDNFKKYQDELSKRMHYQYAFETMMAYLLKSK
jgi:hypothetical protein